MKTPEIPHVTCSLCHENFADEETLDVHQRTELDRHQPSNRFLKMPELEKCYSKEALWAQGWRSTKHTKTLWVWTRPPMPKLRAHKINEDETYQCLFCKNHFKDATAFKAHFVNTFTPVERCLSSHELKALDYEQSANGIWRQTILTQLLPSQAARLPSVRQELAAFNAGESVRHELTEISAQGANH